MVTGNLYKPSDKRIKSDIKEVDPTSQLDNIRNLKIYDYIVRSQSERGGLYLSLAQCYSINYFSVLAQELQAVIPQAVHTVGDVDMGNQVGVVPDFMVVNERYLLFDTIGATKQLDKALESEKQNIIDVDTRVANLKETAAQENTEVNDKIRSVFDVLFEEEMGNKYVSLREKVRANLTSTSGRCMRELKRNI